MKVLGVCGGIGSGKSTASKLLVSDLGCIAHIDADKVAHSVYDVGSDSLKDIVKEFGNDILQESGEIDRKRLGAIVFGDSSQMKKLEHIVWPHVQSKVQKEIETFQKDSDDGVIVVEAAMLLDADWQSFLDGVWVVQANEDVAIERLVQGRGMTAEDAKSRIEAQKHRRGVGNLTDEVNTGTVSAVIDNSGSLEDLKAALSSKLQDTGAWYDPKARIAHM